MFFGQELNLYESDIEKAEALKNLMKARATGNSYNESEYKLLREYIMDNHRAIVPSMVRMYRSLDSFWDFISSKYGTYKERRMYIDDEFSDFLYKLESSNDIPNSQYIATTLDNLNSEHIVQEWKKAIDRKIDDPSGAITMARTLLESTIKYILEDLGIAYTNNDDLTSLYKKVSKELDLYPEKHEEAMFKSILGSCSNIVDKLGSLRNGIGDAHGKGKVYYNPHPRHSELAVNLAGTMALFLIDTHNKNKC